MHPVLRHQMLQPYEHTALPSTRSFAWLPGPACRLCDSRSYPTRSYTAERALPIDQAMVD